MLQVQFYRTAAEACPVEEFLDSLNAKQAQKVLWVLRVVQELPRVPQQYLKKLEGTDDLWEVRAEFGGDAFRLLGFWDAGRLIILTNGFAKKTQKTPEREIALAQQRKRDHLSRRKQK
ncbi:MAG TPA: type II toxin-antitoxin system RelE/ParE family toxin [Candidatus Aquilonibacter sp.]|nr:type II toxin-antitoxin system RelE/ParE family toxin [Candidatus Aquilonibacter sp.]